MSNEGYVFSRKVKPAGFQGGGSMKPDQTLEEFVGIPLGLGSRDHRSLTTVDHHVHEPLSLFAVRRKLNSFQAMATAEPMQIVGEPTFYGQGLTIPMTRPDARLVSREGICGRHSDASANVGQRVPERIIRQSRKPKAEAEASGWWPSS